MSSEAVRCHKCQGWIFNTPSLTYGLHQECSRDIITATEAEAEHPADRWTYGPYARARLTLGGDQYQLSIEHWGDNIDLLETGGTLGIGHTHANACALCAARQSNCSDCPLAEATGVTCQIHGSLWRTVVDTADRATKLKASRAMLKALQGLVPAETEPEPELLTLLIKEALCLKCNGVIPYHIPAGADETYSLHEDCAQSIITATEVIAEHPSDRWTKLYTKARLVLGGNPLELSIEHWENCYQRLQEGYSLRGQHRRAVACALCVVHHQRGDTLGEKWVMVCGNCPLNKAEMNCYAPDSLYQRVNIWDPVEKQLKAAKALLNALKGLRPESKSPFRNLAERWNKEYVLQRLEQGEDPLTLSIEHWGNNAAWLASDPTLKHLPYSLTMTDACACCVAAKYECGDCAIVKLAGKECSYIGWSEVTRAETNAEQLKAARHLLHNLQKLQKEPVPRPTESLASMLSDRSKAAKAEAITHSGLALGMLNLAMALEQSDIKARTVWVSCERILIALDEDNLHKLATALDTEFRLVSTHAQGPNKLRHTWMPPEDFIPQFEVWVNKEPPPNCKIVLAENQPVLWEVECDDQPMD